MQAVAEGTGISRMSSALQMVGAQEGFAKLVWSFLY